MEQLMMTRPSQDNDDWLGRLQQCDAEALAELFAHYRSRLLQMVQLRIGSQLAVRIDPADVLQEVYMDAARKVHQYVEAAEVSPFVWLRGLTWDRLSKLQRQHLGAACRTATREIRLPEQSSAALVGQLLAPVDGPRTTALRAEMQDRVRQALDLLDHDDREVILMRHFEEMSNDEVAETLGLTASAATMRHGRALLRLKTLLEAGFSRGASTP
jgi:RNA polymerase sigma-70 factor (ECF subfamily)